MWAMARVCWWTEGSTQPTEASSLDWHRIMMVLYLHTVAGGVEDFPADSHQHLEIPNIKLPRPLWHSPRRPCLNVFTFPPGHLPYDQLLPASGIPVREEIAQGWRFSFSLPPFSNQDTQHLMEAPGPQEEMGQVADSQHFPSLAESLHVGPGFGVALGLQHCLLH